MLSYYHEVRHFSTERINIYKSFTKTNRQSVKTERRFINQIMLLFPLFFRILLWLIYALNIIQSSNFEPVLTPIISFLKTYVAENVAKLPAEWFQVVVGCYMLILGLENIISVFTPLAERISISP